MRAPSPGRGDLRCGPGTLMQRSWCARQDSRETTRATVTLRCASRACFCANSLRASSSGEMSSPCATRGGSGSFPGASFDAAAAGSLRAPAQDILGLGLLLHAKPLSTCQSTCLQRSWTPIMTHAGRICALSDCMHELALLQFSSVLACNSQAPAAALLLSASRKVAASGGIGAGCTHINCSACAGSSSAARQAHGETTASHSISHALPCTRLCHAWIQPG